MLLVGEREGGEGGEGRSEVDDSRQRVAALGGDSEVGDGRKGAERGKRLVAPVGGFVMLSHGDGGISEGGFVGEECPKARVEWIIDGGEGTADGEGDQVRHDEGVPQTVEEARDDVPVTLDVETLDVSEGADHLCDRLDRQDLPRAGVPAPAE